MNFSNSEDKILVLYDGMCVLCSKLVIFLLRADKKRKLHFGTLQGFYENVNRDDLYKDRDSIIVVKDNQEYYYSEAIIQIGLSMGGVYKCILLLRLIPVKWRNNLYKWIARNRYYWFGKRLHCHIPNEEDKERFI